MQRWSVHLEGGPRRVNHAAVPIGRKIYSFGGYCTGEDFQTTRPMDVHLLCTVSYRWTQLPIPKERDSQFKDTPYQRYGHTAVTVSDAAYIWGGRNDRDGACNVLYCFESENKWSRPKVQGKVPGARDGHSACVINKKMYIFGGYEEEVEKFSNEIHCLDFNVMDWTLIKATGKPARWRDFHSAIGIGETMYIFGGRSDRAGPYHTSSEIYCDKIQTFDTTSQTWAEPLIPDYSPVGRRSHSAFLYKNEMYIFGGYNGIYGVHFGCINKYNPETNIWQNIKVHGHGPCARRRQCCCLVGDRVFLFGGTSPCPDRMEGMEFDLMDHSDLYVLDFNPSLRTLCFLSVIKFGLETTGLPRELKWELSSMTTNSTISRPLNMSG